MQRISQSVLSFLPCIVVIWHVPSPSGALNDNHSVDIHDKALSIVHYRTLLSSAVQRSTR
jgi:hypothetical protein